MREYENFLMYEYRKGTSRLTKKEKQQKKDYGDWWKSLDNAEAMKISKYLHDERVSR